MNKKKSVILATAIVTVLLVAMIGSASAADCGAGTAKPVCECGDTVKGDFTFTADMTCTNHAQNGLIIGASDITIDGAGHRMTGNVSHATCIGSQTSPCVTHSGIVNDGGWDNVVVEDLEIKNFCTGVVIGTGGVVVEYMNVTGCKIHDCGKSTATTHGIHLVGANYCNMTKNEIYNIDGTGISAGCGGGGNGIFMHGYIDAGGDYNTITCNYLHSSKKSGFFMKYKCMHCDISHNNASDNLEGGITPMCKKSNYNTIEYNIMSNNGRFGLKTQGSDNTLRYNTIRNNGWYGIWIKTEDSPAPSHGTGNDLFNNTLCGNPYDDIHVTNSDGSTDAESNTCDKSNIGGCDWSCDSLVSVYYDFDKDGYYSKDPADCTCNNILDVGSCCNPGLFAESGAAEHCAGGVCILAPGNDPNDCDANVVPPIQADVTIEPEILNVKSNGEWISAYIELPEDHNVKDIDLNTVFLEDTIPAVTDAQYGFVTDPDSYLVDHDGDEILERMVKFNRTAVIEYLGTYDFDDGDTGTHKSAELFVTGEVAGAPFEGSDTVRVRV